MARDREELTETELAEEALQGALEGNIEWAESNCYFDEDYGGRVVVHSSIIVAALREAVKCWVRDTIQEIEDEKPLECD